MTVLLDTNIILEHFRSNILFGHESSAPFVISVITEAELLRYAGLGTEEMRVIELFLTKSVSIGLDSRIARRAATLGRTRKMKLPDLFIAATALELGLPLITRNMKDFKNIPNLIIRKEP